MKCQAWVDPTKFNKKNLPTPRSFIGSHLMIPDIALSYYDKQPKQRAKLAEAIKRMVRCGGHVEFSMYADCGDEGTDGIEVGLQCAQCGETSHPITMSEEIAAQWIQERLDAIE